MDSTAPEGKTTSELQSVTGCAASSVYADWNANVDGVSGNDAPWDFGEMMQYPMLKFGCMTDITEDGGATYEYTPT